MAFLSLSGLLLFAAYPLIGTSVAVWILAASQLALLIGEIRKRQISGAGAFIFMSLLFFGVRPIFMVQERDYGMLLRLFLMRPDLAFIGEAMWWASAGLLCFALGAHVAPKIMWKRWQRRRLRASRGSVESLVSAKMGYALVFFQLLTLPIMYSLSQAGRGIYRSSLGAYAYDLPMVLQSFHIIAVVVLLERYLRNRLPKSLILLGISGLLFLNFTWLMRDVSMFRGFYLAGVMIVGIGVLQRVKGRVGYAWLIIPIIAVQPFFQYLGANRSATNEQLSEIDMVEGVFRNRTVAEAYWHFYDSKGDMNIFDTYVAAFKAEPAWYPYAWSWLYVPLHFIPRGLWHDKPEKGMTQDIAFLRGAPNSPGIVGFFLIDGGVLWMLLSMLVLGYLLAMLDGYIFTMPAGYLRNCLIGIVTVNAMFLSRFLLWQYFYQMLYAIVPCVLLAWYVKRSANAGRRPSGDGRRVNLQHFRSAS